MGGLQKIEQQSDGHSLPNVMAELRSAGQMQRKLLLYALASDDPSQGEAVRSAMLQTAEHNLQYSWQLVLQTHEEMLVSCLPHTAPSHNRCHCDLLHKRAKQKTDNSDVKGNMALRRL